jgi:Protein of unknown function (DUF3616)
LNTAKIAFLGFSSEQNNLGRGKELRAGLSAVVQIGDTLWLANDETISLERLSLLTGETGGNSLSFGNHTRFSLNDYIHLPVSPSTDLKEADIEGLAYENGYIWLVGSHSLKRKNPDLNKGNKGAQNQLAKISRDGNRYLLARIPVVEDEGTYLLVTEDKRKGEKATAAQLRGNEKTNDLFEALKDDEHLGSFFAIPGKDNGFDIEGLAIAGARLFLGLRGPVLRGWAVILEVELVDGVDHGTLQLKAIGPNDRLYRKHFLHLGGLGIRDLCRQGDDLLILAGPTMDIDGPVTIFRWPDGTVQTEEGMVPTAGLEKVLDVPYGQGVDHAEGMTLFSFNGDQPCSFLVVYDSASTARQVGGGTTTADIFFYGT